MSSSSKSAAAAAAEKKISPSSTTFINFGCWNKNGCKEGSGLYQVSELLKNKEYNDVDFFIVNGDNYYQQKNKEEKTKTIIVDDLVNGFNCLNTSANGKEVFLLMGNHDIEPANECKTIKEEKKYTNNDKPNIHFPNDLTMFKEIPEQNTLIIMIDSNLYTGDNLQCYRNIIEEGLPENDEELIVFLQETQEGLIKKQLDKKNYKNIIICAHHPLIGFKNQKIKNGKAKGGIDTYDAGLYRLLYHIIQPHALHFYYLCADIHNYQQGIVKIKGPDDDDDKFMEINQYISGTGGADLDDDYDEGYRKDVSGSPVIGVKQADIDIGDMKIDYNLIEHFSTYGFMVVKIQNQNITITRVPVPEQQLHSGGIKKRRRYASYSRKRKNKTRKYKKKRGTKKTKKLKTKKYNRK